MALAEQTACSGRSLASLVTWARLALCAPRWVGLRAQGVTSGLEEPQRSCLACSQMLSLTLS